MFFRLKWLWICALFCVCALIFLGVLLHPSNRSPKVIKVYKATVAPPVAVPKSPDVSSMQAESVDEAEPMPVMRDSGEWVDFTDVDTTAVQPAEVVVHSDESPEGAVTEVESDLVVGEERFFGLTVSEIEAMLPVLESEIRTNLTQAVGLYADLRETDGLARTSPEIAAWRDETWKEIKQLFYEASREKIPRYVSYLLATGGENPLRAGGMAF